jgi:hypothetical protein
MSVVINGSAGVTTNSGAVYDSLQRDTAKASTSGTSIDFTGIPSWVRRITVMFQGVSTNGTSSLLIQIGAGSVTSTGYASTYALPSSATISSANSTAGFIVGTNLASAIASGAMTIQTLGSNNWVSNHAIKSGTTNTSIGGGDVTLSGTLDRVRITTVNGTDTFDAGSINIIYE